MEMMSRSLTDKSDALFWHRLSFLMIQCPFFVLFFKCQSVQDYILKNLYKIVRLCLSSMVNVEILCFQEVICGCVQVTLCNHFAVDYSLMPLYFIVLIILFRSVMHVCRVLVCLTSAQYLDFYKHVVCSFNINSESMHSFQWWLK